MGRKSRLENFLEVLLGNAAALIFEINLYLARHPRERPSHIHVQPASRGHRAKRVERQVQQNLLQAVRIGMQHDFPGAVVELTCMPRCRASGPRKSTVSLSKRSSGVGIGSGQGWL